MTHRQATTRVFIAFLLATSFGCGTGSERSGFLPLTVHIVEASGQEYDLGQISQETVRIYPLTTKLGAAESLDANLARLSTVRQQKKYKIATFTFADGSSVSGRPEGNLEGMSEQGPRAVPWDSIKTATVELDGPERKFEIPEGPWIRIAGDGIESIDLYGVSMEARWIVRHGSHAYRQDIQRTESLPFTVPRELHVREEWEIPGEVLKRIELYPSVKAVIIDLGQGEEMRLEGEFGARLRQYEGSAALSGRDHRGLWSVNLQKLIREVRKVGVNADPRKPVPRITVEFFGRPQSQEGRPASSVSIGKVTDWDARTLPVSALWLETLVVETDGSTIEISPENIRALEILENPWEFYDPRVKFDLEPRVVVTLRDGSDIHGSANDHFGYLECAGPEGAVVYLPSYGVRRLELEAGSGD